MSTTDTELLTVRQAATRLGINRGTLYRLVRQGDVPAIRVGGSIRLDPRASLEAQHASRRSTPP